MLMNIFLCRSEGRTSTEQDNSKKTWDLSDTFGWMDTIEANTGDPGQYEGDPAKPQQFVAESPVLPQDPSEAVLVHQSQALVMVQPVQGGHSQTQQEEEEQDEVETLPHKGGLVQHLLLALVLQ